jgi:hypothetical protein
MALWRLDSGSQLWLWLVNLLDYKWGYGFARLGKAIHEETIKSQRGERSVKQSFFGATQRYLLLHEYL